MKKMNRRNKDQNKNCQQIFLDFTFCCHMSPYELEQLPKEHKKQPHVFHKREA